MTQLDLVTLSGCSNDQPLDHHFSSDSPPPLPHLQSSFYPEIIETIAPSGRAAATLGFLPIAAALATTRENREDLAMVDTGYSPCYEDNRDKDRVLKAGMKVELMLQGAVDALSYHRVRLHGDSLRRVQDLAAELQQLLQHHHQLQPHHYHVLNSRTDNLPVAAFRLGESVRSGNRSEEVKAMVGAMVLYNGGNHTNSSADSSDGQHSVHSFYEDPLSSSGEETEGILSPLCVVKEKVEKADEGDDDAKTLRDDEFVFEDLFVSDDDEDN